LTTAECLGKDERALSVARGRRTTCLCERPVRGWNLKLALVVQALPADPPAGERASCLDSQFRCSPLGCNYNPRLPVWDVRNRYPLPHVVGRHDLARAATITRFDESPQIPVSEFEFSQPWVSIRVAPSFRGSY